MNSSQSESFQQRFRQTLARRQSLLCVGLDPEIEKLPSGLPHDSEGLVRFCHEIISATAPFAAAFKINFAFFEAHGAAGWEALQRVAKAVPAGLINIADAKRGDIGNTARLYARSIFHELGFDAMTANPYLGEDAATPFLESPSKGVFFLCRTSNPGSGAIQCATLAGPDIRGEKSAGTPLYLHVARQVASWNSRGNAGLVVGATHPHELEIVRRECPAIPMLIPGVGTQGGNLDAGVRFGATASGDLAVINASRAILYADSGSRFAEAAARTAESLRNQMNESLIACRRNYDSA